jgi:ribonuclease HI
VHRTPLSKIKTRRRRHICSDSRTAIAALAKNTTQSALVWERMQVLEKLSGTNKVTSVCTPRHQGTESNEEADKLAK